jgi:hypothetical protein
MDEEEKDNLRNRLANATYAFSIPTDYAGLIERGLLKKVGKSYYVDDINALPENVRKRIKDLSNGRYGTRVTFYKESKSAKKMADKLEQYRD